MVILRYLARRKMRWAVRFRAGMRRMGYVLDEYIASQLADDN